MTEEWPPRLRITTKGWVCLWFRSKGLGATNQQVDELIEALGLDGDKEVSFRPSASMGSPEPPTEV